MTIRKKTRRMARGTARRGFRASPTVTATISVPAGRQRVPNQPECLTFIIGSNSPMKEKADVIKVEKKAKKL